MKYDVVYADNVHALITAVEARAKGGWTCTGGVHTREVKNGVMFYQAMVRK